MNKSNFLLFLSLFFIINTHTMDLTDPSGLLAHRTDDPFEPELRVPRHYPQDLSERIVRYQLLNIHNQVNTPEEARNYLVSVSLVNKECNALTNNPHVMKEIISNLSATLRNQQTYIWYEQQIAEKLNTTASQAYIELNSKLFSEDLTVEGTAELLKQGADPNYRRDYRKDTRVNNVLVHTTRYCYSGCPLIFYASDPSDNGLKIAKCLLENGANVNIYSNYCYPLNAAINKSLVQMVMLLLTYDPKFVFSSSIACLTDAINIGDKNIISLLQQAYPDQCKYGLKCAIEKRDTNRIQELFDHGATPDYELEHVVERTLSAPTHRYNQGAFSSTELLQLFCNNGIQDQHILATTIARARATKKRAKEVIAILEKCNTKS